MAPTETFYSHSKWPMYTVMMEVLERWDTRSNVKKGEKKSPHKKLKSGDQTDYVKQANDAAEESSLQSGWPLLALINMAE